MKIVQVVDGAENCIFPVYRVTEDDFKLLFPEPGQNVEFSEDLASRLGGERAAGRLVMRVTARHVRKDGVAGINGTLFVGLPERRKYFPRKREGDVYVP